MRSVCLVSGGLDSFLCWNLINDNCIPVFVKFGQQYVEAELAAATKLYNNLCVVSLDGLPTQSNRYIPCRNLMFCTLAVQFDCNVVYVAGVDDDIDIDKSPAEFERMSKILSLYSNRPLIIKSPLWGLSKAQAVANYLLSGGDRDLLKLTYSCYKTLKCYGCDACYRWGVALLANSVDVEPPSIECLIRHGVKQLWHKPTRHFDELCRALSFIGVDYSVFDIKDNCDDFGCINDYFLSGGIVILRLPCNSGDCTLVSSEIAERGVLFHGVIPAY